MAGREYHFWVYVLASRSRNLYVGMTNDLVGRLERHRAGVPGSHTERYRIGRLVYFEYFRYVRSAIAREKEVKRWRRAERVALIERGNPTWEELWPVLVGENQVPFGDDRARRARVGAEAEARAEAGPLRG